MSGREWDEIEAWKEEQARDWSEYLAALHEKAEWERLAPGNDDDFEAGWYQP